MENSVTLNSVHNRELLLSDITNGRWDRVLDQINKLVLPKPLLTDLYEQMFLELLEGREITTATEIFNLPLLQKLETTDPER